MPKVPEHSAPRAVAEAKPAGFEILVVPSEYRKPVEGEKGLKGLLGGAPGPVSLDVELLKVNLKGFLGAVGDVMSEVPKANGPFCVDEIEFTVEVNAEGSFQLIGGAKLGAKGGLTVRLKRSP
jgi:hypothetical protein